MKTGTMVSIYWYSMYYCVFSMWFIWVSHRWFNKPVVILLARFVFLIACISTIFYTFGTVIDITFDIKCILSNDPDASSRLSITNGTYALISIGFICICYFKFWKSWWYYVTHTTKTIQAQWYTWKYKDIHINEDIKQESNDIEKSP